MDRKKGLYIYIYICSGILYSHKENEILPFAMTWIELERIMLSKISQLQKDICDFTRGI